MSDDRMEWNVDACREVIRQLNQHGTAVKDYIGRMYFQFRLQLSQHWTGKNYNNVVDYVNGYANQFRSMTQNLAVVIPTNMQDIVNTQALDGQGTTENFVLVGDNNHPDIWEVPHSDESADGRIYINLDVVHQFFESTVDPSILNEIEHAKTELNSYVSVLESNMAAFNHNGGVQVCLDKAREYKTTFEKTTDEIVQNVIDAAKKEISGIEDVKAKTTTAGKNIGSNDPAFGPNSGGAVAGAVSGSAAAGTFAATAMGNKTNKDTAESGSFVDSKSTGAQTTGNKTQEYVDINTVAYYKKQAEKTNVSTYDLTNQKVRMEEAQKRVDLDKDNYKVTDEARAEHEETLRKETQKYEEMKANQEANRIENPKNKTVDNLTLEFDEKNMRDAKEKFRQNNIDPSNGKLNDSETFDKDYDNMKKYTDRYKEHTAQYDKENFTDNSDAAEYARIKEERYNAQQNMNKVQNNPDSTNAQVQEAEEAYEEATRSEQEFNENKDQI